MKRVPAHPTMQDWLDWIHQRMPVDRSNAVESHLQGCRSCSPNLSMLQQLRSAQRLKSWRLPPHRVRERARRMPQGRPAPRPSKFVERVHWQPADIRGGALLGVPEPRTLTAALAAAEISIVATPPSVDPFWLVEGRVWFRKNKNAKANIVLLQDDHVVAQRAVGDSEYFEMREILAEGWELEVHFPDEKTLKLSDRIP